MVELAFKLVSLRVKTCYKTTALKFNIAGRTSSLASRLLHNLCSEPTPAFFAMLAPFVPSKSSPFQKPQRLHHDDNLPSSLCTLLIFIKGWVSTVPTRRSRIIRYPEKLEKLGDPDATQQRRPSWTQSGVRYTCLESWLHLWICDLLSLSLSVPIWEAGESLPVSKGRGSWSTRCTKMIPVIVWDPIKEMWASLLEVLPVLQIDLNRTEIMTPAFKRTFRDFWNQVLKSNLLASISSGLNCWTEYYIVLLKNSILVKMWPLSYFFCCLEK